MDSKTLMMLLIWMYRRRRHRNKMRRIRRRQLPESSNLLNRISDQVGLPFEDLKVDPEKFFNHFKMNLQSFDELLFMLTDHLKSDAASNGSFIPIEKLVITIRYLATGCHFANIDFSCSYSIENIIKETCQAIWIVLKEKCMPELTQKTLLNTAKGFMEYANFPNCLGAIGGKIIKDSIEDDFDNVLLASCDANYMFTFVNVALLKKAECFSLDEEREILKKFCDKSFNVPLPKDSNTSVLLNYSLIGSEAFGFSEHILTPFSGKKLNYDEKIFNYRLSRARRCIECTFGMLTNKWNVLHTPLNVDLDFSIDIIKACCILHNFVLEREGCDFDDTFKVSKLKNIENINVPVCRSITTRNLLKDYFVSKEGVIPSQHRFVKRENYMYP